MRNVIFILFFCITSISHAQVVFDKSYGGVTYNRFGRNIELANNNGYLINASLGTGYMNTVLYRINATGDTLWTRRFGNDSIQFKTYEMVGITNGGYLMCGDYQHVNTPYSMDSYLMEIDSLGHTVWFNQFGIGNAVGGKDYASNVLQLANGNIVTIGSAKHTYTDVGTIQNYGYFQGYAHLFDSYGDSLRAISLVHYYTPSTQGWNHRYYCYDAATFNNRVCIVGARYVNNQISSIDTSFVLLLDSNLDTIASVYFPIDRSLISVEATPQGTFVVFGDDLIAEIDTNGNVVWQRQILLNNWAYTKVSVRQNGEIVVLESADGADIAFDVQSSNCQANGLVIIHTIDNAGNEICADTVAMGPASSKGMVDFVLEGDSIITMTGGIGVLRMWTVQFSGRCHSLTIVQPFLNPTFQTFPNPCLDIINVSGVGRNTRYSIIGSTGQTISESRFDNENGIIIVSDLAPGFYTLQVCDESGLVSMTSFVKQ